jgi:hypothetical protein
MARIVQADRQNNTITTGVKTMNRKLAGVLGILAMLLGSTAGVRDALAAPVFHSTSSPTGNWFVSTNVSSVDTATFAPFKLGASDFNQAVAVTSRPLHIANNNTGTNGIIGNWTQFVFRQTFDLTGYDPASAVLKFKWAADDSGEIIATRGQWIPRFKLNDGVETFYPGSSPGARVPTYNLSPLVTVSSGFISGLNTIDFFVQGNGVTDGFALETVSFTANIPVPAPLLLLGTGIVGLLGVARRRK